MSDVQSHFDGEADRYDHWKQRNWYYYDTIKRIYRERIAKDDAVLEVGCGTGEILAGIQTGRAMGIDISPEMIRIAAAKHPQLEWHAATTAGLGTIVGEPFDVVFLSDVIEHIEDVPATFRDLRSVCRPGTRLLINMANPAWEPLLLVLEKLGKKMPEGPHHRISVGTLTRTLADLGFALERRDHELLFPAYIPVVSALVNAIGRLPLIRRLSLIEILEYRFSGEIAEQDSLAGHLP
ncbi:MAG: class I SAM-dependent methyltransferase [Verrucomicrobia bacterium]|nr:class I SAM-dependent methyltransferase [Verrucomicrobiota bacterium]